MGVVNVGGNILDRRDNVLAAAYKLTTEAMGRG